MSVLRKNLVMEVRVIDKFLNPYQFKQLQSILMADDFPWFFNGEGLSRTGDGRYQFIHGFHMYGRVHSEYYSMWEHTLKKLGVNRVRRIKANLNHRTVFHRNGGWHYDLEDEPLVAKTSILYINTNNGYTRFKKGGKIKCVENRMVIFPSDLEHSGFSCTDEQRKVVVNFNYE